MSSIEQQKAESESDEAFTQSPEYKRFEKLGKALFAVPKKELDDQLATYESPSAGRKRKPKAEPGPAE